MHDLTWSMLCPISGQTTFKMEIFGALPSQEEVRRIRTAIETSLLLATIHVMPVPGGAPDDGKKREPTQTTQLSGGAPGRRPRQLKDLGPCPIHGHQTGYRGRHPKTNRCLHCLAGEPAGNGNGTRTAGAAIKRPGGGPPAKDPRLALVWSQIQATCISCGDRVVRFHRSAVADMKSDFWVHDRPSGLKPCLLNIAKNDHVKADLEYQPGDEVTAKD